jgi:hypothetical protein
MEREKTSSYTTRSPQNKLESFLLVLSEEAQIKTMRLHINLIELKNYSIHLLTIFLRQNFFIDKSIIRVLIPLNKNYNQIIDC